ncbi:glycoside hydrolase [Phycomyces nitens]|nr:glycoside hydrolase [Phycomyces nitens]
MWFDATKFQGFQRIRHACDQGDNINGYGYNKHDGRNYAKQKINDGPSNIAITTEFIKVPGGQHGGDWGVRVRGKPMNDNIDTVTSIFFSLALEGEGSMDIVSTLSAEGLESPVKLEGDTPELGDFEINIIDGPLNEYPQGLDQDLSLTQWWGLVVSARQKISQGDQHDAFERPYAYFTLLNTLTEEDDEVSNFYTFQKVFSGEFQFDVLFRSQSSPNKITSDLLTTELVQREKAFDGRFQETFRLHEKGFSDEHVGFAQYLLSNMLGGIGYFYGSSVVDRSHPPLEDEENFSDEPIRAELTDPRSLFTATPSRPFFPRGFYWDEGFHELLIGKWDNDLRQVHHFLSLDIIKNWVSLIDENGWVAREQILGEEARSKVPAEFQTQFPHYANPPTLYLAIKRYLDRLTEHRNDNPTGQYTFMSSFDDPVLLQSLHLESPEISRAWLRAVYPKLRLNWQWFRTTQNADLDRFGRKADNKEAYRWRGRTANHTLTSGLDDYPRGEPPNVGELHVDLLSWMSFATRLLKDISSQLGPEFAGDVQEYTLIEKDMLKNLEVLHWNEASQAFCDQTIEDGEPVHVCHKGYISIFPVILGLLEPDSPKVKAILDIIEDEKELWSPYGLRSLSASDKFYNTGEDYWRGPIWININYLTLQSLYNNYMRVPGPYQAQAKRIYNGLRQNIINAVFEDYQKTGYVWEQYSDKTGQGKRSHPFTGWTSLVLLIMAEEY